MKKIKNKAFTLIELLLVTGVALVIGVAAFVAYSQYRIQNNAVQAASEMLNIMTEINKARDTGFFRSASIPAGGVLSYLIASDSLPSQYVAPTSTTNAPVVRLTGGINMTVTANTDTTVYTLDFENRKACGPMVSKIIDKFQATSIPTNVSSLNNHSGLGPQPTPSLPTVLERCRRFESMVWGGPWSVVTLTTQHKPITPLFYSSDGL